MKGWNKEGSQILEEQQDSGSESSGDDDGLKSAGFNGSSLKRTKSGSLAKLSKMMEGSKGSDFKRRISLIEPALEKRESMLKPRDTMLMN